jgi:NAD(P)H dehydrogenase (quinone)
MPRAFIPAITGHQSAAVAEALREAGWNVSGSSRTDQHDLRDAAAGAELLVLTIPQDHRPGAMTGFVGHWVEAAQSRSIERIILNLGGTPGPAEEHPFFADLHSARAQVAQSGVPFVVLQPTVYLDNLAAPWARDALDAGMITYPAAPEAPVSWLSHRTLGAWVAAVAGGGADGRTIAIGGPKALTGAELAREIGRGLGRDLQYVPVAPSDFAQAMNAAMGEPAGDRLAAIYERHAREPQSMKVDPALAREYGVELEDAAGFAARALLPG